MLGTWVELSKHWIDTINRKFFDGPPPKLTLFETKADAMIDIMFVALN